MRRKHRKTRRALLIVFLVTLMALAIIYVLVRQPGWYLDLTPNHTSSENSPRNSTDDSFLVIDREWALPAIMMVVSLGGMAVWLILLKANR
jgi:hypothetical protein